MIQIQLQFISGWNNGLWRLSENKHVINPELVNKLNKVGKKFNNYDKLNAQVDQILKIIMGIVNR